MIACTAKERELFKKDNNKEYYNKVNIKLQNGNVISNDKIVGESLKITERMCSESKIKFGLCEAKSIEIDCFDIEDVQGQKIEIGLNKISLENGDTASEIPLGTYHVKSCKKQGVDGRRKIIGYDDLQSSTLDADASEDINKSLQKDEPFKDHSIYQIEKDMLSKYGINRKERENEETKWSTSTTSTNYFNSDTEKYFVAIYSRYLRHTFDQDEYYMFDVPESLQTTRRQKVDNLLSRYDLSFSGSDSFWLSQLCYLRLYCTDGSDINYAGRNDGIEYTRVRTGTIFVTEKIEIRYGTERSSSLIITLNLGYEDALEQAKVYKIKLSEMEKARLKKEVNNITLRNIIASIYELQGTFGRINRTTGLLESAKLNNGGLYPRDSLTPSDVLYPNGGSSIKKSEMMEVWFDENKTESFGGIKLHYKALSDNGEESENVYEYIFDDSIERTYEVKDNWILDNIVTTEEQIAVIAEQMAENIRGINVCSFTTKTVGLPYLEVGDMIEIPNESETKKVYILERTISGIQDLKDEMSALGGDG